MEEKACIYKALRTIGAKWTIPIIYELFGGTKRFGQLQSNLIGISPKTLSIRLKELEKDKIISKKVFKEIPLHVEYTLTPRGESLKNIIHQMHLWGEKHHNNPSH